MKRITLFVLLLIFFQTGKAQMKNSHEFSFWGGGGLSSMQYDLNGGKQSNGTGGIVGLGYTYHFTPNWGFTTGAELGISVGKISMDSLSYRYETIDDENSPFTLLTDVRNFNETQYAYYLNIPLMFQYQGRETNTFYVAAGVKLGIPINGKYNSTGDYLTRGKYNFTQDIFENMPDHGFTSYNGLKSDGKLDLNMNIQFSAEAGYKWHLNEMWHLYTGLYLDYGMSDILTKKADPVYLLNYNASDPAKYIVNSIAQSGYLDNGNKVNFVDKINTFSLGVKVKFAFAMGVEPKNVKSTYNNVPNDSPAYKETPPKKEDQPKVTKETAPKAESQPKAVVEAPSKKADQPKATKTASPKKGSKQKVTQQKASSKKAPQSTPPKTDQPAVKTTPSKTEDQPKTVKESTPKKEDQPKAVIEIPSKTEDESKSIQETSPKKEDQSKSTQKESPKKSDAKVKKNTKSSKSKKTKKTDDKPKNYDDVRKWESERQKELEKENKEKKKKAEESNLRRYEFSE